MTSQQKIDVKTRLWDFPVDLKNLMGFAVALWGSAKTETLIRDTKIVIFKGKRLI